MELEELLLVLVGSLIELLVLRVQLIRDFRPFSKVLEFIKAVERFDDLHSIHQPDSFDSLGVVWAGKKSKYDELLLWEVNLLYNLRLAIVFYIVLKHPSVHISGSESKCIAIVSNYAIHQSRPFEIGALSFCFGRSYNIRKAEKGQ